MHRLHVVGLIAVVCAALCACSDGGSTRVESALGDDAITVGSFDFAESRVLAEVYSQALEAVGLSVVRAFDLGPREFVAPALQRGLIELVPEYAGTATTFLSLGRTAPGHDVGRTHAQLDDTLAADSVVVALAAAPAQDANTFVVTTATADRLGLRVVSDLAGQAAQLTFGGPEECPSRPLCLRGLHAVYGLDFARFVALDAAGPVTRQALQTGAVDVGLLLSTDPALDGRGLVALVDDRGLQPADNVVPLVRREVIDRWGPRLAERIDAVSAQLTTTDLRALDRAMASATADVGAIAHAWLEEHDLT